MKSNLLQSVLKAIGERLSGSRPGFLRSLLIAIGVGIAAAVLTYRLLRSGG